MKVIKFGGSALVDANAIGRTVDIIEKTWRNSQLAGDMQADGESLCVVASAMAGVNEEIAAIAEMAARRDLAYKDRMITIRKRHMTTLASVAHGDRDTADVIQEHCIEFGNICDGVYALGELSPKVLDRLVSFGVLCSALIVTAGCRQRGIESEFVDTRDFIRTDEQFGKARVDFDRTTEALQSLSIDSSQIKVLPGGIARSEKDRITTLGRNGSDYSAAILSAALGAGILEIWTDVDGVMTADPNHVTGAQSIEKMSYIEAMELSHFGARVLHAPTLQPLMDKEISLRVCNTFHPEFPGTLVGKGSSENRIITGISAIERVSFIRVQGSGMVGVFGVAGRLFSALAEKKVNLIMISQGSSEHSICFAVQNADESRALDAIEREFTQEIRTKMMDHPVLETDMCVLAVVGEHMRRQPGIAGKVFGALGNGGINVVSIAQGSSELNISMVIQQSDAALALNVIHNAFF